MQSLDSAHLSKETLQQESDQQLVTLRKEGEGLREKLEHLQSQLESKVFDHSTILVILSYKLKEQQHIKLSGYSSKV